MNKDEIEAILEEENAALRDFLKVSKEVDEVGLRKQAARARLMLARSAKHSLLDNTICK